MGSSSTLLQPGQELDDAFTGLAVRVLLNTCAPSIIHTDAPPVRVITCSSHTHNTHMYQDANGLMSVAGFGSLLSETSARTTFPELINFRMGKVCYCTPGNLK